MFGKRCRGQENWEIKIHEQRCGHMSGQSMLSNEPTSVNLSKETGNTNLKEHNHPYVHLQRYLQLLRHGRSPSIHQ